MKFIHLSDLHFHSKDKDNKEAKKTLKNVKDNYHNHYLIVTGDIVDDGKEIQFKKAFDELKPFIGRIYIVPGNHDFGALGNLYSRERAIRFDELLTIPLQQGGTFTGDCTPVVNIVEENNNRVMLIALDTNLKTAHPFDFSCGKVGKKQLKALKTIIKEVSTKDTIKILFFHHHPFMFNDPFMELKDAKKLMRTIYNRVDVVLFGHKHASKFWVNSNNIKYMCASDNSPGKGYAREITVENNTVKVGEVSLM